MVLKQLFSVPVLLDPTFDNGQLMELATFSPFSIMLAKWLANKLVYYDAKSLKLIYLLMLAFFHTKH